MEEQSKAMKPEEEEQLNKYFRRIREEVKKNIEKKWDAKRYAASAGWLLARFGTNQNPEFAEEAATYILAGTFLKRGNK